MRRLQGKRRSNLAEMFVVSDLEDNVSDLEQTLTSDLGVMTYDPSWYPRCAVVGVLALVAVGVGCTLGVYTAYNRSYEATTSGDDVLDVLDAFSLSDATNVRWASLFDSDVTSLQRHMTPTGGVIVTLRVTSVLLNDNMTEPVILPSGGEGTEWVPLRDVLEYLVSRSRVGVLCEVSDWRTAHAALSLFRFYHMVGRLRMPVWMHTDAIGRPGDSSGLDVEGFTTLLLDLFPKVTLSLGWATRCSNTSVYKPVVIKTLWNTIKPIAIPISFAICLEHLGRTWPLFNWILNKDPKRFSLNVYNAQTENSSIKESILQDLLLTRNDLGRRMLFLNIGDDILAEFKRYDKVAGTPTNVFQIEQSDAAYVRWSRATNTKKTLLDGLNEHDMLLGDVSSVSDGTLWMGRLTDGVSHLTLKQWLGTARNADVGVKIHIRSDVAIAPTVKFLQHALKERTFQKPLWIQADIFEGQDSREPIVNRRELKLELAGRLPFVTICLGWTTGGKPGIYTKSMLGRMIHYAKDFRQPVVLAIRAGVARASWPELMAMLERWRGYKLLVWAEELDVVDVLDLVYLHQNSEVHRVFYCLPTTLNRAFLSALTNL